jgi:2-polyprenyl-6-hydroxyphenyl methylase/3-demethylubiquinone-9 3-methyltransferase
MNNIKSTIDNQEVEKFAQHADHWWDLQGPLKTLHDINPTRLEFINQHVALKGTKILDVGCGGGILCEAMAKTGAFVTGIDAEYYAIETAKKHANENQLVIDYQCTPIEEFEHNSFDVVTCMEMLEHVQTPELVLEHCKRLLKPNGLLFLSTISRTVKAYASAIIAAEYLLKLLPRQTHDYNKFIKPSELIAMARSLDLNLVDMKGLTYNPLSRSARLGTDVAINYLLLVK